jgi:hypothetical protein
MLNRRLFGTGPVLSSGSGWSIDCLRNVSRRPKGRRFFIRIIRWVDVPQGNAAKAASSEMLFWHVTDFGGLIRRRESAGAGKAVDSALSRPEGLCARVTVLTKNRRPLGRGRRAEMPVVLAGKHEVLIWLPLGGGVRRIGGLGDKLGAVLSDLLNAGRVSGQRQKGLRVGLFGMKNRRPSGSRGAAVRRRQ